MKKYDFTVEYSGMTGEYFAHDYDDSSESLGCICQALDFKTRAEGCGYSVNLIDEGYEGSPNPEQDNFDLCKCND